ncbi:MAG: hypothetical protein QOI35_4057 [Cryptosporangiaceae bacterium]|jgi:hypothetical protein|nr:hypothetical protein [Cryptosporangiaceae bacterium]
MAAFGPGYLCGAGDFASRPLAGASVSGRLNAALGSRTRNARHGITLRSDRKIGQLSGGGV